MPDGKTARRFDFLRSRAAMGVTILLAAQIVLFYAIPTREIKPTPPPLDQFSNNVGPWVMTAQHVTDKETNDLLRADDTLDREYKGPNHIELFVAFFKSQRAGVTPHSPKMCLPASGWADVSSGMTQVQVPGETAPISVNRYVVSKDGDQKLFLYWFQNPHRVTANEYLSRLYLVYDSLRYRRSDEAMVRVSSDLTGDTESHQEQYIVEFIQALYQPLRQQIWFSPASASVIR